MWGCPKQHPIPQTPIPVSCALPCLCIPFKLFNHAWFDARCGKEQKIELGLCSWYWSCPDAAEWGQCGSYRSLPTVVFALGLKWQMARCVEANNVATRKNGSWECSAVQLVMSDPLILHKWWEKNSSLPSYCQHMLVFLLKENLPVSDSIEI